MPVVAIDELEKRADLCLNLALKILPEGSSRDSVEHTAVIFMNNWNKYTRYYGTERPLPVPVHMDSTRLSRLHVILGSLDPQELDEVESVIAKFMGTEIP
jgi:hypothetical protein